MNQNFDAIEPKAGFYETRLVRGGPPVGVRIWHGAPLDPVTGEVMDRSHRWQAEVNGEFVELDRVWPGCAAGTISETEYVYRQRAYEHAIRTDAYSPIATPRRRVDWETATPPSF